MHKKRSNWLLWSITVAVFACSPGNPASLRDTTATAIIEERWNEAASVEINLGPVQFHRVNISSETHAPVSKYAMYQAVARMRLIKLENERNDLGGSVEGGDRVALTAAGVPRILNVSLTAEGQKIATIQNITNSNVRSAIFQCGKYRVKKIILNKPLQIYGENSRTYRTILGTHVFEFRPDLRELCLRHAESKTRERHFRALLKHNPVSDSWSLEASDVGPREFDFESENVPLMLAKLRADRRFVKQ